MKPLALFATDPRSIWRNAQIVARTMDANIPFWWKRSEFVHFYTHHSGAVTQRCWEELVRQRQGN